MLTPLKGGGALLCYAFTTQYSPLTVKNMSVHLVPPGGTQEATGAVLGAAGQLCPPSQLIQLSQPRWPSFTSVFRGAGPSELNARLIKLLPGSAAVLLSPVE